MSFVNGEELPPNWVERYSRNLYRGRLYYFNIKTREKSWNRPEKNGVSYSPKNVTKWLEESTVVVSVVVSNDFT